MTDAILSDNDIQVAVRRGWEVELGDLQARPGVARRSLVHLANFALPAERGDYGSGAVEQMDGGGILIVLLEFDPGGARAALFSGTAIPTTLSVADFSPDVLQRRLAGQVGAQRFFQAGGRAFGLYVVLGSGRSAPILVPELNRTLAGITIS